MTKLISPVPSPLVLLVLALLATSPSAQDAAPDQTAGVRIARVTATVEVVDGVATTRLRGVARNDGARDAEAVWVLPLPSGAVADRFEMTVGGTRMTGEVLGAEQARSTYEAIVRRRRDPGLLEYFGRGCLRARLFPIPARGEVAVEVGFRHLLEEIGGLRRWTLALGACGIDGVGAEQVVLDLRIRSRSPIRNVFSPNPGVDVALDGDHSARVSFEGRGGDLRQRELAVVYGLSDADFGLDLLSHRKKGEKDGWFMLMVSPRRDAADERILKKSVVFALDTSGSMAGAKIAQARDALRFFVRSLRPQDRFNVVPFSTEPQPFFPGCVDASPDNVAIALDKIAAIEARGGTNIAGALRATLAGAERGEHVAIAVLLTDGKPTVEETDPNKVIATARDANAAKARIFVFGVGHDVDTHLLDTIAADSGGTRDYVREGEDIEEKTGALLTKLESPAMTDVALAIDGLATSQLVPARLPDLFRGGRLVVLGRYADSGHRAVRLSGTVGGVRREYVYEADFADEGRDFGHDFVPKLWAERRVATLLDAIRLNGAASELVEEVQRLGREYGVVTPYTSHLIVEEGLALAPRGRAGGGAYRGPGDATPPGRNDARGLGAPGPSGPSTPGPAGGASPAGPATGGSGGLAPAPSLDELAGRLRDAGVLPPDASVEELRRLAGEVARELRDSESGMRDLGRRSSGREAVEESAYLARLVDTEVASQSDEFFLGAGRGRASLLARFVRTVKDKTFVLRRGVWVDREFDEARMAAGKRVVPAWSKEWFDLLDANPELRPYLAFSARLIVVVGEQAIEVVEKGDEGEAKEPGAEQVGR